VLINVLGTGVTLDVGDLTEILASVNGNFEGGARDEGYLVP
jgi:hypothetical protein